MEKDFSGLRCPVLILQVKKFMKSLSKDTVVTITVTDMDSEPDFIGYAATTGNQILSMMRGEKSIVYTLKKS